MIDRFGGSKGIRDLGNLEAALARPYHTFDKVDLYQTSIEKAATLFESLIINHPFIDGNKRIAFSLMALLLLDNGLDIDATSDEIYSMVIAASTGTVKYDEILNWLKQKTVNI